MKPLLIFLCVLTLACHKKDHSIWLNGKEVSVADEQLAAKEVESPGEFLFTKATMRKNILGQRTFTGSVTNYAQAGVFKDIEITFHFLDESCKEIGSHTLASKDPLPPGNKLGFKIKVFAPDSTEYFECSVKAKPAL